MFSRSLSQDAAGSPVLTRANKKPRGSAAGAGVTVGRLRGGHPGGSAKRHATALMEPVTCWPSCVAVLNMLMNSVDKGTQ